MVKKSITIDVKVSNEWPVVNKVNIFKGEDDGDAHFRLDKNVSGDTHYLGFNGKVYEFKLSDVVIALINKETK